MPRIGRTSRISIAVLVIIIVAAAVALGRDLIRPGGGFGSAPDTTASAIPTDWVTHQVPGRFVVRRWRIAATDALTVVGSGDDGVLQPVRPQLWSSPDRVTWTRSTIDEKIHGEVTALTATPSGFTAFVYDDAVGDSTILTTRDGVTWVSMGPLPRTTGSRGGGVDGTVALGSTILAVGASGSGGVAAWSSTDGLAWTALGHITPGSDATLRAAAAIRSGVAGVGRQGFSAAAWTSPDGADWTQAPIAAASSPIGSLAPAPTATPAATAGASPGTPALDSMVGVAADPDGRLLAVGGVGPRGQVAAWSSVDGHTWTTLSGVPADDAWPAIVATTDGWIVLGSRSGRATAWSTADGNAWTPLAVPSGLAAFDDALISGGRLVAVGKDFAAEGSFVIVEGTP